LDCHHLHISGSAESIAKVLGAHPASRTLGRLAGVGVTCPAGKWEKARGLISSLSTALKEGQPLHRKSLESTRGFLNHVAQMYPVITPFSRVYISHWMAGEEIVILTYGSSPRKIGKTQNRRMCQITSNLPLD